MSLAARTAPARFLNAVFARFASLGSFALPGLSPLDVSSAPSWFWLFHPSALVFVRQRGLRFFSLADRPHCYLLIYASKRETRSLSSCQTIGPALCSAGRSNRSFRLCNNTRLFFSALRPGGLSPFPVNLFAPRAHCFFNRALSPCVFRLSPCRSYRRFVSPRRPTRPRPAARRSFPDAAPCCFTHPRSALLPGRPLAPLPGSLFHLSVLNDYLA